MLACPGYIFFFFNDTATTEIYTLSYTTLFRSHQADTTLVALDAKTGKFVWSVKNRSEEHTSELQSQSNLVCRLLLEKKKKAQSVKSALDVTTLFDSTNGSATTARSIVIRDYRH